jgi:hypothetical protein
MTTTARPETARPPATRSGPGLLIPALTTVGLFVASLLVGLVFAGKVYANPFSDGADLQKYFVDHATAIRWVAFLQLGSAITLVEFTAAAWARLREFTPRITDGVAVGTLGGAIAGAFLALNAFVQWTLTQPEVSGDLTMVRALNYLFFALGGPAHVSALGLLVLGFGVASWVFRIVPRSLGIASIVVAALCELSTITVLTKAASPFIPLGRFTALIWVIVMAVSLRKARAN